MSFIVYPKEGEPFPLKIPRLVINENKLNVYNDRNAESNYGFLSMDNIAAILPDNLGEAESAIIFNLYLKDKKEPLKVSAHTFKANEPPSVRFYWRYGDREEEIRDLYVALSEVVAIVPADFSAVIW